MKVVQDIRAGWRARPLNALAAALLAFGLSLLIATGIWLLQKAEKEADRLLESWPADQCTLLIPDTASWEKIQELELRLPPHHWLAFEIVEHTAWISGNFPGTFFNGKGSFLPPEVIARGEAAVLLQESVAGDLRPGDLLLENGQAYRIYGVGNIALPVEKVIPRRAKDLLPPSPDQYIINQPASLIRPQIRDLLKNDGFQLIDHREKQQQALEGFRKLRRNLSGIAVAAALLAALLLQALYQAEIRERKSEFALRRSLGARPEDIRNQILMEVLLGNVFPCVAGTMIFLPLVPFPRLFTALILTLGWILFCACFPALQAARLSPGDALKGE